MLLVCISISQIHIDQADASIKPIITTQMPKKLIIGLQETNLSWFIIDDNLASFNIYINGLIWRNGNVTSNLIETEFSNVVGTYNLTLNVNDFSNNMASDNMTIIVSAEIPTTTSQSTYSTSYTNVTGAPGFNYIELIVNLFIYLLYNIIIPPVKYFKKQKKS